MWTLQLLKFKFHENEIKLLQNQSTIKSHEFANRFLECDSFYRF